MKQPLQKFFYVLAITGLILVNLVPQVAFGAAYDSLIDTISDSRTSTDANHTILVGVATGDTWAATETLIIDFVDGDGFDLTGFASSETEDFDIRWGGPSGTEKTIVDNGSCVADSIGLTVNTTTDTITFTLCSGSTASSSGDDIHIEIGTNATSGGSGDDQINNATSTGSKIVNVSGSLNGGTAKDTLVAITDGVTLSATVDETLTFTVAGTTTGTCTVGGGTEIDTSGNATTIPFGTVSSDTFYDACQQLTTGTNASGGYSTTVQTTSLPTSGGNTIAKGNCEGACSDTAEAIWDTAAGNNGYGYCMDDTTGDGAATADAGWGTNGCQATTTSQFHKTIANAGGAQTAQSIMASSAATTANDVALIGYRLNVGSGQAAGTYQTTIVYICTPTF